MKKQILMASILALGLHSVVNAQMRITNTTTTGPSVNVVAPAPAPPSNSVMVGDGTGTNGVQNTLIGSSAGGSLTGSANGQQNTMVGAAAGWGNTDGSYNTFIGHVAGVGNTTGEANAYLGWLSGFTNTQGKRNTMVGAAAGYLNTSSDNSFFGNWAGGANSTGTRNTYIGQNSGQKNTTGNDNTFVGQETGSQINNSTGSANTFVGQSVGVKNETGWANTFLGAWTGNNNTSGTANTFIGQYCGIGNSQGGSNVFIGQGAAPVSNGNSNVFIGKDAAWLNTAGDNNTFLGRSSGQNNTSGDNNIAIGNSSGFSSGNLQNAIAIGLNSRAGANNTMSLGGPGDGGFAIKVGIGAGGSLLAPSADLHLYKNTASGNSGTEILSHWGNTNYQSALTLRTGTSITNDLIFKMYGTTSGVPLLPLVTGGPALLTTTTSIGMGLIGAKNTPLMIGIDPVLPLEGGSLLSNNVYFVNNLTTPLGVKPWECIRINKDNGFVGIHSRTATTGAGSGEPQALFHVNLTNPANPHSVYFQGIRFEGLGYSSNHPDVIVIDNDGNLAKRDIGSLIGASNDWHTDGNFTATTIPIEFIGTRDDDDFRIRTNNTQRARITSNTLTGDIGNFELGTGSTFANTNSSVAIGTSNSLDASNNAIAIGNVNTLNSSDNSGTIGLSNNIDASANSFISGSANTITGTSTSSAILGSGNTISGSTEVLVGGSQNSVTGASNYSLVGGFSNTVSNSSGVFSSGISNYIAANSNNSATMGSLNVISGSINTLASGQQNSISSTSNNSGAIGLNNTITNSPDAFTAGVSNSITSTTGGTGCIAIGAGNIITNTEASVATGETNTIENGHGTFVTGGHNYSDGQYNFLIGQHLKTDLTTFIDPRSGTPTSRTIIGERINSDLNFSLVTGFNFNRTTVTTERGMAIQLDPSISTSTYTPTVNFEVEAGISGAAPMSLIGGTPRSNIRFHNLPDTRFRLPVVMIDPVTGELFMSQNQYPNPLIIGGGDTTQNMMVSELKKSVEEQQMQIEAQQKQIDELKAIIKNSGTSTNSDVLVKDGYLAQNVPNPFSVSTVIKYELPKGTQKGAIGVYDMNGREVKLFQLSNEKNGSVSINGGDLMPGMYLYTLIINGQHFDSKKMILTSQ